jgi:hypothetical protein
MLSILAENSPRKRVKRTYLNAIEAQFTYQISGTSDNRSLVPEAKQGITREP